MPGHLVFLPIDFSMQHAYIETLLQELPRYAEEEGDCYAVHRDVLVLALTETHRIPASIAETAVGFCERLLETLSVLNAEYLRRGEWCFVSFSAQLLAMSVLTALSDGDSRFFPEDFWKTQDVSADRKDRQRDTLKFAEDARAEYHAKGRATPIRYSYVAWGIIKLDGRILFYQREDTRKRFDKSAGDYGLIGGRANQTDLPMDKKRDSLRALQSADSEIVKSALPETLKRELREETGLLYGTHYTFAPWRVLRPYRQVQGAAPYHALTEYHLEIFGIVLNLDGYFHLCRRIKGDERLVWFSIDEMVRGESTDGKVAYIKALFDDYGNDRERLREDLANIPVSFQCGFLFKPEKYGMTLTQSLDKPVIAGVLGKEKPLDTRLSMEQHAILLGLAAHVKGFEFSSSPENIRFHPCGWVEIAENMAMQSSLRRLTDTLKNIDVIIENHSDTFFRLSVCPEILFFDETLFTISFRRSDLRDTRLKISALVTRKTLDTAFGKIEEKSEEFKVTIEFSHKLIKLRDNKFSAENDDALKAEDAYKKGLHKEPRFQSLGLRSLIRRDSGVIGLTIPYTLFD